MCEEMKRVVRYFKFHQHDWLLLGEKREAAGRPGAAAYARKYVPLLSEDGQV